MAPGRWRCPAGHACMPERVFVKINGQTHSLWRAVDHEGDVLESFVSKRRDRKAALKFLRKTMKRHGQVNILVTDKLRSYGAAMKVLGNAEKQETGRWLNNRSENSRQPFRRRERAMQRFRFMRTLQKFASVHASVHNHFNQERSLYSRQNFTANRTAALSEWRQLWHVLVTLSDRTGAMQSLSRRNVAGTSGRFRVAWVLHGRIVNARKPLESCGNVLRCVATQERRPLGALHRPKHLISCVFLWLRGQDLNL